MAEFITLDENVLALMLENMSYKDIRMWCDSDPAFRELCKDEESVIGKVSFRT